MNINAKFRMNLSLDSIEGYKEFLEKYSSKLPQIATNIVKRVSEVGLEDNHKSTTTLSVTNDGNKITGGIKTNEVGETYAEFGTGIVGQQSPHIAEYLEKSGWKYDVNEHGEKGWVYFKDGQYYWTKGIPANRKFANASKRMEDKFGEIAREEFKNASK